MITQTQYKLAILNARRSLADDVLDTLHTEQAGGNTDWKGIGKTSAKIAAAELCLEAGNISSAIGLKYYYYLINVAGVDYNNSLTEDGILGVPSSPAYAGTPDVIAPLEVNIASGTPNPALYEYLGGNVIQDYHLQIVGAQGALYDTNVQVQRDGNKFYLDAATDENGLIADSYVLTLIF